MARGRMSAMMSADEKAGLPGERDVLIRTEASLSRLEERFRCEAVVILEMMRDVLNGAREKIEPRLPPQHSLLSRDQLSELSDLAEDVILHLGFFGRKEATSAAAQILELVDSRSSVKSVVRKEVLPLMSKCLDRIEADLVKNARGQRALAGFSRAG